MFASYQGGNRHHVIMKMCVQHLWGQVMHEHRIFLAFNSIINAWHLCQILLSHIV